MNFENNLKCPNCLNPVTEEVDTCPNCNTEFYNCSNCNALVLETETVCKNCNSRLDSGVDEGSDSVVHIKKSIYEYKSLEVLTNILLFLLSAEILFSVINIYADANEISFLNANISSGGVLYYDDSSFESIAIAFSQLLFVIIFFTSLVVYFLWVRQAYRNLSTLQLKPAEFSSGWSIGSYFVPILNLFRPYTMMKEIWFGSQPKNNLPDESESEKLERLSSTTFLKIWWAVFLTNGVVSNQSFRLSLKAETPQKLLTSYYVDIISYVTGIILCLTLLYLISTVKNWQLEKNNSKLKRYCQHCGSLVEMDALLCTSCGKQLLGDL